MPKRYLILACDGGGMRGYLTARLIQELDTALGGALLRCVDLFAGTSTGGLLALGLAARKPEHGAAAIKELVRLYKVQGASAFKSVRPEELVGRLKLELGVAGFTVKVDLAGVLEQGLDALQSQLDVSPKGLNREQLGAFLGARYSNDDPGAGLQKLVKAFVGTDTRLSLLPRNVLVTTLRLDGPDGWQPLTLHNLPVPKGAAGPTPVVDSHLLDAAMATTAAPTYFAPWKHTELGYCVDGGVFANNPAALALSAALAARHDLQSISVLSVGTGGVLNRYPIDKLKVPPPNMGILAWMWPAAVKSFDTPEMPLLNAMLDGTAAADELVCRGMLGNRYRRIQPRLPEVIAMDEADAPDRLEKVITAFTTDPRARDEWKKTVEWVREQIEEA
ncbi:patatin-like phospholipase family protein [Gemmata sp. JC673]|uniref:Patatin-like phospholipase family protein n=1 Tax=Gemmata algarum TaxID=2975278 RepID=A0ABU5F2P6_9BACT|nr:patatin-like phospholipase family protein [Gemmata algarum]MDY3560383.1 patatin-like phospholipase family protein [Gemmata algarum]